MASSSLPESLASMAGTLKVLYGDTLVKTFTASAILGKRFQLAQAERVGSAFQEMVGLQLPAGHGFQGDGVNSGSAIVDLPPALAGVVLGTSIIGSLYSLQDDLNWSVLFRTNGNNSKQSIMDAMSLSGLMMAESARNVLEIMDINGQSGLGVVSGPISSLTVTFDGATTSPAILSSLQGQRVMFSTSVATTARTASDFDSNYLQVASVDVSDPDAPTITLVATGTTNVAAITTGDILWFGYSRGISVAAGDTSLPYLEPVGLDKQLSATSGTYFGISKSSNPQWISNQVGSVGQISPSALIGAAARIQGRGCGVGNGKLLCLLNPRAYGVIASSLQTQEVFGLSMRSVLDKDTGTEKISIGADGLELELVSHPFVKQGQAMLLPEEYVKRYGSHTLSFELPFKAGEYVYVQPNKTVVTRVCHSDCQLVVLKPPAACIMSGITY
jgi:hypothetical protein